jgi:Bifunctional DNA primase/polymerase, N-terminal
MLSAGQAYIGRGWHTFVLSPTKTPVANCEPCKDQHIHPAQMEACPCLCCHGFYAATLDCGRLAEMLRLHPRGLLAVRTGAPSGIAVTDVDRHGIGAMRELQSQELFPRTVAAATGGGGYHLVYAHPGFKIRSGAGKYADGIDSKADGGYIVTPPSVHPATRQPYRWLTPFDGELAPLPKHWAEHLRERPLPPVPAQPRGSLYGRMHGLVQHVLAGHDGDRNGRLYWAACRAAEMVTAGEVDRGTAEKVLIDAALESGLRGGEAEARRTVSSAMRQTA